MPNTFLRDLMTGIVAIVSVIALILMLLLFGELKRFTERTYDVHIAMRTASGLTESSAVLYNGVRVGAIQELRLGEKPTDDVVAVLRVRREVNLPRALAANIELSFVGNPKLNLTMAADADPTLATTFIDKEAYRPHGPREASAKPLNVQPTTFFDRIEAPLASLATTADSIQTLAETYNGVGKDLRELLRPRTPEEVNAGAPATISSVIARADRALAGAETWLADGELLTSTKSAIAKVESLTDDARSALKAAEETARTFQNTSKNLDTQLSKTGETLDRVGSQVGQTLDTIQKTSDEINQIVSRISRGEGTMGQLINNPDLYRSLDDAAQRLKQALDEATLLLEKFKTEGLPLKL